MLPSLAASELELLWQDLDQNKSGSVDHNEFLAFISMGDQLSLQSREVVLALKKQDMGLNAPLNMLRVTPASTTLSVTHKIRGNKINPCFDFKSMKYFGRAKDFAASKEFVVRQRPRFCFEFAVTEVVGAPLLSEHVELRCFLFDSTRKLCLSNVHIAHATSTPWAVKDSMCVRSSADLQLVFELVSIDAKQPERQLVLAWAQCTLQQSKSGKLSLPLFGGSPFSEKAEIVAKEPKQGFFASLKAKPERHLAIDVRLFDKLDETTKAQLCLLREDQVVGKKLLGFATCFQLYAFQQLVKAEMLMQVPLPNHVLAAFNSIYDSPDLQ